jgi:hypothetical protein
MVRLQILTILIGAALAAVASSAANSNSPSCEGGIVQTLRRKLTQPIRERAQAIVEYQKQYWSEVRTDPTGRLLTTAKNTALIIPRQQKRYWSEAFKYCKLAPPPKTGMEWMAKISKCVAGVPLRIAFVERDPRDRVNGKHLIDPLAWYGTLWPEVFKWRYNFSIPSQALLSLPPTILYFGWIDGKIEDNLWAEHDQIPGAAYALELDAFGQIDETYADKFLNRSSIRKLNDSIIDHSKGLMAWYNAGAERAASLPRISELKSARALENDDQVERFAQLARRVFYESRCPLNDPNDKCGSLPHDFWLSLKRHLRIAIEEDPVFKTKSRRDKALLMMAFLPKVETRGDSDIKILAKSEYFAQSFPEHPALALYFESKRDGKSEAESKKVEQWKEDLKSNPPRFTARPDIPRITVSVQSGFDANGTGKSSIQFKDELSLWKLAWTDARFSDIRERYKNNQTDEWNALQEIISQVQGYNDVYAALRDKDPYSNTHLCKWLDKKTANSVVRAPVFDLFQQSVKNGPLKGLPETQKTACAIEFAEFFEKLHALDLKILRHEVSPTPPNAEELDQTIARCWRSTRKCDRPIDLRPLSLRSSEN